MSVINNIHSNLLVVKSSGLSQSVLCKTIWFLMRSVVLSDEDVRHLGHKVCDRLHGGGAEAGDEAPEVGAGFILAS